MVVVARVHRSKNRAALAGLRIPIVSLARSHHIASHHGIAPPTHSSTSAISSTSISINSTTINYLPASICHYNDD